MTRDDKARADVRTCWVEIVVALLFIVAAAVVITDSIRVGTTWGPDGPGAGYFPFYIGCILAITGAGIVVQALRHWLMMLGGVVAGIGRGRCRSGRRTYRHR